jgi:hypothetical protein
VAPHTFSEWEAYWEKYQDVSQLRDWSMNIDETLLRLEQEFDCKFLSGDHIHIIASLEDRIDTLEAKPEANSDEVGLQGELFG